MTQFKINSIELDEEKGHYITGTLAYRGKSEQTEIRHEGRITPEEREELDNLLKRIAERISNTIKEEIPELL